MSNVQEHISLVLKNVSFGINGKAILKDISFAANAGDIIGFIGPNGAGKTTTMRLINGVYLPLGGDILINNINIAKANPKQCILSRKFLGYLPEGGALWGDMTPKSFLEFISAARKVKNMRESIIEAVKKVEIETVFHQRIDTLSKGYKRRVAMAGAIVHNPDILILDEPTDGLDPNQKTRARQAIKELAQGKITVISTHILEEVTQVCNRVILINDGKIIIDEPKDKFLARGENLEQTFHKLTHGNFMHKQTKESVTGAA